MPHGFGRTTDACGSQDCGKGFLALVERSIDFTICRNGLQAQFEIFLLRSLSAPLRGNGEGREPQ
jgi:hypothetical protein